MDPEEEGSNETSVLLNSSKVDILNEADLYEKTVSSCGFGKFQVFLLLICGWALASDSVEIQVVSFVLPSACDLHMTSSEKGWLNAIIFVGMICGGYTFGGVADIKGRRFVLLWSMTINGIFGLASAFSPYFVLFLFLRFLSGIGVGGAMPVLFSYFVEFMPKARRGPMIGFMASFWMFGNILTSLVAWLIIPHIEIGGHIFDLWFGSWRIFVALGAFPSLSAAMLLIILPESPKYLQKVGRDAEATDVFTRMFHANNGDDKPVPIEIKEFSEAYYKSLSVNAEEDDDGTYVADPESCICSNFLGSCVHTLAQVFNSTKQLFNPPLLLPTVILLFVWFTLSFGYYGLWMWFPEIFKRIQHGGSSCGGGASVNYTAPNMTCLQTVASESETYVESFYVALANLPGNIFVIIAINKVGRRAILAVAMVLSGVTVFFFWLVTNRLEMIIMSCIFSGISVAGWNALDALALENYPTHLRSTAFGLQATVGRVAAILGNVVFGQLVDIHCSVPLLLVASLLGAGGLLAFKLPKTDKSSLD